MQCETMVMWLLRRTFHSSSLALVILLCTTLHVSPVSQRPTGQDTSGQLVTWLLLLLFPGSQKDAGLRLWTDSELLWSLNICLMLFTFVVVKRKKSLFVPGYLGRRLWKLRWTNIVVFVYVSLGLTSHYLSLGGRTISSRKNIFSA